MVFHKFTSNKSVKNNNNLYFKIISIWYFFSLSTWLDIFLIFNFMAEVFFSALQIYSS